MTIRTKVRVSTMDLSRVAWRKSSRSEGNGGACVEVGVWRKSEGNRADCVGVASAAPSNPALHLVRDSKDPFGPKLAFTALEWKIFLIQIKTATFDHSH